MSTVKAFSVKHLITSGEHKDRVCLVREQENDPPGLVTVVFDSQISDRFALVSENALSQIEIPGWRFHSTKTNAYSLKDYLDFHRGCGSNLLREDLFAQPRVLHFGDKLASGELVTKDPRIGYNSSVLIHLKNEGWVELASRLPIALKGNDNFEYPADLKADVTLMTGCVVAKNSEKLPGGWVNVYLDRKDCNLNIPSCVPLALS